MKDQLWVNKKGRVASLYNFSKNYNADLNFIKYCLKSSKTGLMIVEKINYKL